MTLDYFLITRTVVALINGIGIVLIFLILNNAKRKLAKYFVATTLLMFVWVNFAYLARLPDQIQNSLFWIRIAWSITPFLCVLIYFFIGNLTNLKLKNKIIKIIYFFIGLILFFLTLFSDLIISNIEFSIDNRFFIIYGKYILVYFVSILVLSFFGLVLLVRKIIDLKNFDERKNYVYITLGFCLFLIMNIIFNVILPYFKNIVHLYYFGDYSTIIFLIFLAYAVIKNKFLNIKTFTVELLTFSIWAIIIIEIFLATTWLERIYKLVIFLVVFFIGWMLINSVKNEIKQRERVERLAKQLDAANKKLKKLDQAKSDFISIASHQLRTPLTVTKGYISMMLEGSFGELDPVKKDSLEKVFESNERLIQLVENLLNISRIESGKLQFHFAEVQFEDLTQSVLDELSGMVSTAKKKNLKVSFNKPAKPLPKITIDEEKIRQVVLNLIDNAIKYSDMGSVAVSLKKTKNILEFTVKDTGMGISDEDKARIFNKFGRGEDSSFANAGGAGIGLYVAKQMIEAHQGRIWAESKGIGKGSSFKFTLPYRKIKSTVAKDKIETK